MKIVILSLLIGISLSTFPSAQSSNLITNGDFLTNDCRQQWCIFTSSKCVPGWIPDPQIEIGYGYLYSDSLKNQRVVELAPNKNSCIKQQLKNITPGVYKLKFIYSARKGRKFEDCKLKVSFNGQHLKTITPCDYDLHTQTISVKVDRICNSTELKFCGDDGDNNSYGAIIKSISFVKLQDNSKPNSKPEIQNPKPNLPIKSNLPVFPPAYNPPFLPQPPVAPQHPQYPQNPQPTQQLTLASHSSKVYQKQYNLQGGQYQISFDYRINSILSIRQSYLVVSLNGQVIQKVYPTENGKNIKIIANLLKGSNILCFAVVGCPTQVGHQIIISNVVLITKRCVGQLSNDLIVNGAFQQNNCKADWCIWNKNNCNINTVPGWIANPQIQLGHGNIYNKVLGNSWVAQLDPNVNSCMAQKLNLKTGKYVLNFDWASRSGVSYLSTQFEVKLNGQVLKAIKPSDCELHHQKIQIEIKSCPSESLLEFCGLGKSDCLGALIDNVKMQYYDECASFTFVKY